MATWNGIVARVRALPPARQDLLAAIVVGVAGALDAALYARGAGVEDAAVAFAAAGTSAVAVLVRRAHPLAAILVAFGTMIVLGRAGLLEATNVPFFTLLLVIYSLARHTDGRRLSVGIALVVVLWTVGAVTDDVDDVGGEYLLSLALVVAGPALPGRLLRNRAALARALAEKAERLERERELAATRAVEEERARIAGELHDVVSHAVGAMVVGGAAARRLADRDPARAAQAFASVEETGREALVELRRLLGVLRRGDDELALAPQPSLAHLGDLARRTTRSGLAVELRTEGSPPATLPAGADLTAYRLVQSALTAAREAGRARHASVLVRYEPGRVHVSVRDDGAASARTLLGMRERVSLYGGELHAGPRIRGGHGVRATLPLEPSA